MRGMAVTISEGLRVTMSGGRLGVTMSEGG